MAESNVKVPTVEQVSVICWDASFRDHFDAIDCLLRQTLPPERLEIVFVEYYERPNPTVTQMLCDQPHARIVTLHNPGPARQNEHIIGACVNEGIRRSNGDMVVVPDADVLFEDDLLEEIVRRHERVEDLALYFYRVDEPPCARPAPRTIREIGRVGSIRYPNNYGGCLSVRRRWLEAINGYEEDPLWRGYSAVGRDTAVRLKALGLCIQWHPEKFLYHGFHPGCHAPDPLSTERLATQRAIVDERERRLETLPARGLNPERRAEWEPDVRVRPPGWPSRIARGIIRTVLPRNVRRSIGRALNE